MPRHSRPGTSSGDSEAGGGDALPENLKSLREVLDLAVYGSNTPSNVVDSHKRVSSGDGGGCQTSEAAATSRTIVD
ncbi:hypothetical protein PF005_g33757 [Phytophthora fragariae]|uniref:Uncharacterized protein n=1 Tax=Phytophthora fragariae TaxID=53985 RepID=A0A6A3LFV1_9STRA|nr:hypothetical protein PF011_g6910 [Phytophthora fragariae]KAE9053162.1 hypothetical protein PF006_g33641 [Phytophthora fragariae]KAE9142852.1 hypothetical protein PF005_g33757 [Phytophthora fragariae]KAE9242435.1 hypothetical protein PF001_g33581 [Phytophthora fragariae]